MACTCNNRLVFAVGATVALAGTLLAVIYSATYIPPYVYDQGHESVQCTVLASSQSGNYCCDATWRGMASCTDIIPCYQVVVTYRAPGGASDVGAYLYFDYQSIAYQRPNHNCSYYLCPSTYAESYRGAATFLAEKGVTGDNYTCYRDPARPHAVLPGVTSVLHIVLAVLLGSIAAVTGCLVCCLGYRGYFPSCQEQWEDAPQKGGDQGCQWPADGASGKANGKLRYDGGEPGGEVPGGAVCGEV